MGSAFSPRAETSEVRGAARGVPQTSATWGAVPPILAAHWKPRLTSATSGKITLYKDLKRSRSALSLTDLVGGLFFERGSFAGKFEFRSRSVVLGIVLQPVRTRQGLTGNIHLAPCRREQHQPAQRPSGQAPGLDRRGIHNRLAPCRGPMTPLPQWASTIVIVVLTVKLLQNVAIWCRIVGCQRRPSPGRDAGQQIKWAISRRLTGKNRFSGRTC